MRNGFKLADFGEDPKKLWVNNQNKALYTKVEVNWRLPVRLDKDGAVCLENEEAPYQHGYLYAVIRNHGNQSTKDRIFYISITNDLKNRFYNHPTVNEIKRQRGETSISVGVISSPGRRLKNDQIIALREELEHIYIWVLWDDIWNASKVMIVPGQTRNGGKAWDIENKGFKFSGRMPARILFPWAAIVPRRDNTYR